MIRHTRSTRCPICEGANQDPRGQQKRCFGYTSDDGLWVRCTREELAGSLQLEAETRAYVHKVGGACNCGVEHAPERNGNGSKSVLLATYEYRDEEDKPLYRVLRYFPKSFSQQRWDTKLNDWVGGEGCLNGVRRVLYRLPEVLASAGVILVVEGEKDVDTAWAIGLPATCNSAGAGNWKVCHTPSLAGRDVVIIPDRDKPGQDHAQSIQEHLEGHATSIRILELPAKDLTAWIEDGGTKEELEKLISKEPTDIPRSLPELRIEARLLDAIPKTDFGIKELDDLTGGIRAGWTVVLGAFTQGGKTTFMTFLGISLASRSHPVLIVTNELSEYEVTNRIDGSLDAPDDLPTLKIWSPQGDIHKVMVGIRQWLKSHEGAERTPIILADYLQKFRPDPKEKSRERQVALMAEEFQSLGRQEKCINILAAQLNRESQKEDKPRLHHLRESGLIEQVADVAILLSKPADEQAEFEIAKHRWAKSGGSCVLGVDWAKARYGPLSPIQQWGQLGKAVKDYILASKKPSAKIRDLSNNLTGRPTKTQIIAASQATSFFAVIGPDVFLRV